MATTKVFNSNKYGTITITYNRIGKSIVFTSNRNLLLNEAKTIQEHLGYHPAGYSFYDYQLNTWKCWNSCD